jgi:ribosomal protein S18 acetylase RimI-like enzyme
VARPDPIGTMDIGSPPGADVPPAARSVPRSNDGSPRPAAARSVGPAPAYRLERFDAAGGSERAADLASLHGALLPHSPVALLGPDFMAGFYYRTLPRLGLVFGHVAYVDERPAGFIVATHDSSGFMQKAVRREFFTLARVMAWSVLRHPARVGAVWEAIQIMRGLPPSDPAHSPGELLSFGVLPQFRSRDFMLRTRLRISQDLLNATLDDLRARGVRHMRVIVDADNLEARMFYLGNGWQPGLDVVPGWRKKTVEFVWQG